MKNRWGKKGQFYIIAAVIIIALLVGVTTIVNKGTASPKASAFYDLSSNFETESAQVVDYGIYNGQNAGQILGNFFMNYSGYASSTDPNVVIQFVYGNASGATLGQMSPSTTTSTDRDTGAGYSNTVYIPSVTPTSGNNVSVQLYGRNYDFNMNNSQGFYFIIATKKGGETLVTSKNK